MAKQKCIFIIGNESSGSTLIAKLINRSLNINALWNGRGFNCCNNYKCDEKNSFIFPCEKMENLICHRSMPFGENPLWPPIEEWEKKYDCYFIICTRDYSISKLSIKKRFNKNKKTIQENFKQSELIISKLIKENSKTFIWSYETFMYLKKTYFSELCSFLQIEDNHLNLEIKDGNSQYHRSWHSIFTK